MRLNAEYKFAGLTYGNRKCNDYKYCMPCPYGIDIPKEQHRIDAFVEQLKQQKN